MFLVSLMSKVLTGSLVFYFATSILPTQIDEVWLVRLFPVMRLLQRNPFIQQTSVKTCCVPGLGTWNSKIIKHNHPHFSWHCGSLILFMACLILSSNDEHLVSIIYVIIHRTFFFFAQKSVPRGSSRTDLLGFRPISRCVSIFRRVTRPLEPNLTWFDYRNLS